MLHGLNIATGKGILIPVQQRRIGGCAFFTYDGVNLNNDLWCLL